MSAYILENWSAKYRAWPRVLLDKFSSAIEIESNKYFPDVRNDLKEFYDKNLKLPVFNNLGAPVGRVDASFTYLNPTNSRYIAARWFDFGHTFSYISVLPLDGNYGITLHDPFSGHKDIYDMNNKLTEQRYASPYGNYYYDDRLIEFTGFAIFNRIYSDGQTGMDSYLSLMSFSSRRVLFLTNSQLIIQASGIVRPYSQTKSLIALYENGISHPDIDYKKLIEFQTYLDAYEKYKTQIESDYQLQIQKTAADLNQYEQQLIDKFNAEKSGLQNLKIQIGVALSNEAASAKRDFLNLFLNTQNLQVNLGRQ